MQIFKENNLYGLKNDCGEILISPQYIDFYSYSCGLACVRNDRYQYAYIDINNNAIIPFGEYVWIDPFFTCGYARVKEYSSITNDYYWGIINTIGDILVPMEYDKIWVIEERYINCLKAYKNGEECRINLNEIDKWFILDGLKYIKTYSIEEFKTLFNVSVISVRINQRNKSSYFSYGSNIGIVSDDNYIEKPVISIVSNSAGKLALLLHHKDNTGKVRMKKQHFKYQVHQNSIGVRNF